MGDGRLMRIRLIITVDPTTAVSLFLGQPGWAVTASLYVPLISQCSTLGMLLTYLELDDDI